jgi:RND superfamily putative drug exporter
LAKHGVIKLNGQSQGILSILVIGAATDYSLLLIARFREALEHNKTKMGAMLEAYRYSLEPIIASAATVILALLCLLFSDLNSNKSLGPIAAIGIAFALISAISLLPSFLLVFGRVAFWPFVPKLHASNQSERYASIKNGLEDRKGLWKSIPEFVSRKYRYIWVILVIILVLLSLGLTQIKASGVSDAATILGKSNAVAGQTVLSQHYPGGSGTPVQIITSQESAENILYAVKHNPGISSANIFNLTNGGSNSLSSAKVVDGEVLINATLKDNADSLNAQQTVSNLRKNLSAINSSTLVGGQTAISLDTNITAKADLHKIIPIVLVVILVILIILLRALVAPILLVLSVILSFGASLGFSALMFNHVFHFPGADPSVPLFGFIFLVALGIDYNIFLMSRVREESKRIGTRPGILRGLSVTGGVITSAGIVLAATFSALAVIPILFLVQIAFIVAFGVLLDSILVRTLLVPSITFDIGRYIWWPSNLSKKSKT